MAMKTLNIAIFSLAGIMVCLYGVVFIIEYESTKGYGELIMSVVSFICGLILFAMAIMNKNEKTI